MTAYENIQGTKEEALFLQQLAERYMPLLPMMTLSQLSHAATVFVGSEHRQMYDLISRFITIRMQSSPAPTAEWDHAGFAPPLEVEAQSEESKESKEDV